MSARQFARNADDPRVGAVEGPLPADGVAIAPERAAVPDVGRVLAEINHELGNYFHKLYYWADSAGDSAPSGGASPEMLGRTLQGLESFLRAAFGHFQPVELERTCMSVSEVAAAIAQHLRAGEQGDRVDIAPLQLADPERSLSLDAGRLSQLVGVMAQRVLSRLAGSARLQFTTDDRCEGGVAFRLTVASAATVPLHGAQAVLAWAKARQLAELHGGRLWEADAPDAYALTLFLPA